MLLDFFFFFFGIILVNLLSQNSLFYAQFSWAAFSLTHCLMLKKHTHSFTCTKKRGKKTLSPLCLR